MTERGAHWAGSSDAKRGQQELSTNDMSLNVFLEMLILLHIAYQSLLLEGLGEEEEEHKDSTAMNTL